MPRIPIADLRRALDARRLREADVEYAAYTAPLGSRGLHTVEWPIGSGNIITVGSSLQGQTFRPGTVVPLGSHTGDSRKTILGGPPSGLRGTSAFPSDVGAPGSLESIGILSASPSTLPAGSSVEPVTLTGFGFLPSHTFEAVRMGSSGWELDPLTTAATVSVPDSETANITLTISSSAPVGHSISLRIISTPHVGSNLLSVTDALDESIQILAFWRDLSSDQLEAWSVGSDGSPGSLFAQVTVDDQVNTSTFTERGRRMAMMQSIVNQDSSGNQDTPYLVWFVDNESLDGATIKGYAWSPVSGTLNTWVATPRFSTGTMFVSTPFMPAEETNGYIYYLQFDDFWDVLNNPGGVTLYKVIPGSSPVKVSERQDVTSGDYLAQNPTEGSPESQHYISTDAGGFWMSKTSGSSAATKSGDADDRGARGWRPYAGDIGLDRVSIWFDRTGTHAGKMRQHLFDEDTKDRESAVLWATAAASSYTGTDAVVSLSLDRNTCGMYPHNGPESGGGYLKLGQPLGSVSSEGNSSSDPRIFIQARSGHVPHFVHLSSYSHPWS